jgi:release factor glutamine methyltransferase
VLDLGCGSGILSVFAAQRAARVIAVDINPHAVRCTRINAFIHGFETRGEVREGDLFAPVRGERFDLVLFNPPYFHGRAREPWGHAWRSQDVLKRVVSGLPEAPAPGVDPS